MGDVNNSKTFQISRWGLKMFNTFILFVTRVPCHFFFIHGAPKGNDDSPEIIAKILHGNWLFTEINTIFWLWF